jgi:hypothetical protein
VQDETIGNWVTTEDFVEITNMDRTQFYILFIDRKLPIAEFGHHYYINMRDIRARRWLPDYKPEKDLFA